MTDMPDKIMARTVMGVIDAKSGPWAMDDPYNNAVEYVRADLYAKQAAQIAALEAEHAEIRFDALREAAAICEAEYEDAVALNLMQIALGAGTCRRQIERKLPIKIVGSNALKGTPNDG